MLAEHRLPTVEHGRDLAQVPTALVDDDGAAKVQRPVEPGRTAVSGTAAAPAWAWREKPAEGFISGGVHASYLHLHWAGYPQVARRLVAACA